MHNQRIERLWQDVFSGVLHILSAVLEPTDSRDLFCLHHVYNPPNNVEKWLASSQNFRNRKLESNAVVYIWFTSPFQKFNRPAVYCRSCFLLCLGVNKLDGTVLCTRAISSVIE